LKRFETALNMQTAVKKRPVSVRRAALATEMDTGRFGASAQAAPKAMKAYEWMARPCFYQQGNALIQFAVRSKQFAGWSSNTHICTSAYPHIRTSI